MSIKNLTYPRYVVKDAEKAANGLNREDGEKPSRTRRRNRGRKP